MPTQRSANAFAFGARNGVRMISTPSLRKTSSKTLLNLLSRSWIRKRIGVSRSESDRASWRACWAVHTFGAGLVLAGVPTYYTIFVSRADKDPLWVRVIVFLVWALIGLYVLWRARSTMGRPCQKRDDIAARTRSARRSTPRADIGE